MPYTNVPSELTDKMDKCVMEVMESGKTKEQAIAICHSKIVEDKDHVIEAKITSPRKSGKIWDVTIMGVSDDSPLIESGGKSYILSSNGRAYPTDVLKRSASSWDGIEVFDNHLTDDEFKERGGMRSVLHEAVAILKKPYYDQGDNCLNAELRVIDDAMRTKLLNAYELHVLDSIGLSVDVLHSEGESIRYNGNRYPTIAEFSKIVSVDIVASPAAGGRFNRIIAAKQIMEEEAMTEEEIRKLIAEEVAKAVGRSSEQDPDLEVEIAPEEAAAAVEDAVMQAVEEVPESADPVEAAQEVADAAQDAADMVEEVVSETEEETPVEVVESRVRKLECALMLRDVLDAAKLPQSIRRVVEAAFNGKVFSKDSLMNVVKRAKEAQSRSDTSGSVRGAGGARLNIASTMSKRDKAEIAFLELLNRSAMRALESNEKDYVQERIPSSYKSWVNGGRESYRPRNLSSWLYDMVGNPLAMRATEANDVSSITKNALNVLLAAQYSAKEEWWAPIVKEEEVVDINDATLVRDYGFENLSIVESGAAYTSINLSDDEETASFVKHGNYVGVTLETMLKDKLGVLRNIPMKLANAWYNTLGSKVAAVFTTNTATGPVLSDTGALFNATAVTTAGGHANLLTAALATASYSAARTAMLKQTDKKLGTGNRLMIEPRYLLVPVDLETAGLQIRNSQFLPGGANNDVNPFYQQFDIVKVPQFTDTNDWALVADPQQWPAIFLIFVSGYRVPQIITAGDESGGAVFTNDTWRYKVRLMTYRYSSTYDCAPVADFRPLHKSNV